MQCRIFVPIALVAASCGGVDDEMEFVPELDPAMADIAEGKADRPEDVAAASFTWSADEKIPAFRQGDPAWGRRRLFNSSRCKTLSKSGCAVTAQAMLMSFHSGSKTTPREQNDCLANRRMHSGCLIRWEGCRAAGVKYLGTGSSSLSKLAKDVKNGPQVAAVAARGRTRCHHFVLVTGFDKPSQRGRSEYWREDFEILDPATGSRRRLDAYRRVCSIRRYQGNR